MSKPKLETIIKLIERKEKAKKAFESIDEAIRKLTKKYGEGRFDYELPEENSDGQKYLKFELQDYAAMKARGIKVYTNVENKDYGFVKSYLKRIPESLK